MTKTFLICCVTLLVLLFGRAAHAETDAEKQGRAHSKQAKAYFEAGEYGRAIKEYQAAYDLDRKPTRLYNIAICHDKKGDRVKAIDFYQRYLTADPEGQGAEAARSEIARLTHEGELEDQKRREAEAAAAKRREEAADAAKKEEHRLTAEGHTKQAAAYAAEGAYEQAGDEYVAAYTAQPDPEHLWSAAEAYRQAKAKTAAIEQYRRYLGADPRGVHADEARKQIAILTRKAREPALDPADAAANAEKKKRPYVEPTIIDDRPPPKPAPKWLWPTLGGVALGAGLIADLAPGSAHDGKFGGTDLIPVGLYALSIVFVGVWVF